MGEKTIIRRRALLTGGVGAVVGTAVTGLKDSSTAQAADGPVLLGEENIATSMTAITNTKQRGVAIRGSVTVGTGVQGIARDSGHSSSYGCIGVTGKAVKPGGNAIGVKGLANRTGVQGICTSDGGVGVEGIAALRGGMGVTGYGRHAGVVGVTKTGMGVYGDASEPAGVGVSARSYSGRGFAIRGDGRLKFDKVSGQATIAAGQTAVTITPMVDVHAGSFVLLTPMANIGSRGLWFTRNTTGNKVSIHISSPRTVATTIAWLLLG